VGRVGGGPDSIAAGWPGRRRRSANHRAGQSPAAHLPDHRLSGQPGRDHRAGIHRLPVNEQTGARDTLVTYRIQTTGTIEILAQSVGEGFVFTRQAGGAEGGTVLHVLICERTATA
jgi:hypothetical protein